jgi:hypothetical protein
MTFSWGLRKVMEDFGRDCRFPSRNSNPAPSKSASEALPLLACPESLCRRIALYSRCRIALKSLKLFNNVTENRLQSHVIRSLNSWLTSDYIYRTYYCILYRQSLPLSVNMLPLILFCKRMSVGLFDTDITRSQLKSSSRCHSSWFLTYTTWQQCVNLLSTMAT